MEGILTAALCKANVVNENGRIYPNEALEKMVNDFQEVKNRQGCMIGENGYPDENNFTITLNNVSHQILDVWIDGDTLYGKIKILDTENGRKVSKMLEDNNLVFRSRSIGTVGDDKKVTVQRLISFDAVAADTDAFKGLI